MNSKKSFTGFPGEIVKFYKNLKKNNDKNWFNQHRADYDNYVIEPARQFVSEMGKCLSEIAPYINADPRINKSIFKIHRDVRFSKDKTPFKTNLGIWFWEGSGPRMECSGFYLQMQPDKLMLGAGIYMFSKNLLKLYRDAVVHKKLGPELANAIKRIEKNGTYGIGGSYYKRTPRGYDPDHKNAGLLLYNGLYVGSETGIPDEFFTPDIIGYCMEKYKEMLPLHKWLLELTEKT